MARTVLPAMIEGLREPEAFPHHPRRVQLIQTHVSYVLLAGPLVYKIKKPVDFGFLDFTSLEKRRFYCEQEAILNSRLCSGIYLGVVPITVRDGEFAVGGTGEVVDYAVVMRRLPEAKMMNRLLERGQVTRDMIDRLATKLASFYRTAARGPAINFYGRPGVIAANIEENFIQTQCYVGKTLPRRWFEVIASYSRSFLAVRRDLLQRRIDEGWIRDCHGDVRPEHICLADGICIFDCIEFNERFRYSDVAADLAFLVMELDRAKRGDLAKYLAERYVRESKDAELLLLLPFYKCYRAYIRGKVESFKLDQPGFSARERRQIEEIATGYFALSFAYAESQVVAVA